MQASTDNNTSDIITWSKPVLTGNGAFMLITSLPPHEGLYIEYDNAQAYREYELYHDDSFIDSDTNLENLKKSAQEYYSSLNN